MNGAVEQIGTIVEGETPRRLASAIGLPRLLRGVGGAMLVASAATFMVHRWGAGNDIVRYLWLVGLTAVVCGVGWFSGLRLGDGRGARTLLGLVLAVTPVHFAVLGGLVYSQFALEAHPLLPDRALWDAPTPMAAAVTTVLGILLLAGMCWMSLRVFVREHASALTVAYLATNAVLLIPVREPGLVAWIAVALTWTVAHLQRRVFPDRGTLSTGEGRAARALLAVPLLVLVGRTLHLYEPTAGFVGVVALVASYSAFTWISSLPGAHRVLSAVQTFAGLSSAVGCAILSDALIDAFDLTGAPRVLAMGLPIAGVWIALSTRAMEPTGLRRAAAFVVAATGLITLTANPGAITAMLCIVLGLLTLIYGIYVRQLVILAAGALTMGVGVIHELVRVIDVEALTHWAALSALGIVLITSAAIVERRAQAWRLRFAQLRTELEAWKV